MAPFTRLVRFLAKDGHIYHGDAILPRGVTDIGQAKRAHIIVGDVLGQHDVTDQVVNIDRLLSPLSQSQVRTVRCIGLNYERHAKETHMPLPKNPVLFYKPVTSVSGPFDPIAVPPVAQEHNSLDYECELVIVIGKRCINVSESEALDYVLGYAVGNDISHRDWQLNGGGGQWGLGKGFDTWAPFGPGIVSKSVIQDPQKLKIWTRINGKTVQNSDTTDMIFGVRKIIAFLSQGVTLMPGDLIFTGTPEGVGVGRKPPVFLQDSDEVEVGLENVGCCTNTVKFQSPVPKL